MEKYVLERNGDTVKIYNYTDKTKYDTLEDCFEYIAEKIGSDFTIQSIDKFEHIFIYKFNAGAFYPVFRIYKEVE